MDNWLVKKMRNLHFDPFKFLFCISFEATQWENPDWTHFSKQEIIEFPCVLVEIASGVILEEFHMYVRPTKNSDLPEYCIKVTGISQDMIELQWSFADVLEYFDDWFQMVLPKYNLEVPKTRPNGYGNVAFCTWGNWHQRIFRKECFTSKGTIGRAPYFNQWIDVQKLFMRFHPRQDSFEEALKSVGLAFKEQYHVGLRAARSLAKLVHKMKLDGVRFYITKDYCHLSRVNKECEILNSRHLSNEIIF